MRKIITSLFISLDMVVESPELWQDTFDDEMGAEMNAQLSQQDAVLLGRVTYEEWKDYWPTSQDESFASFINNTPKFVVSNTLDKVEWGQFDSIKLLNGDLVNAITTLKQQPGKDIGTAGSPSLVLSLLQNNLVDELRLMVHPVIAGKGKRLFKDGDTLKRLKLIDNKTSSSGVLLLTYQPQ